MHFLRPCLQSLREQTVEHEVVVVDNGSTDGTVAWLRDAMPAARVVGLPQNLGFAGGNNAGLRVARGDLLVLLNNDTLVPPDFLALIAAPMDANPALGSVAGVLTFAHRPEIVAAAGIVPGRDGVHRDALAVTASSALPQEPVQVFGATGGAMCLRRTALEDVGLFEEPFFNYLEDADLAWRLRLRGWACALAPAAQARHIYSATSGHQSPMKQRLLALNRWRVLLRCMPNELLWECMASIVRYDLLAVAFAALHRKPAIVQGRISLVGDLPRLLAERRLIAQRSVVGAGELRQWLTPAQGIRQTLAETKRLDRMLSAR